MAVERLSCYDNRAFCFICPAIIPSRGENTKMGNLSVVVMQLKKARERVKKEAQRIDAALAALGSVAPTACRGGTQCLLRLVGRLAWRRKHDGQSNRHQDPSEPSQHPVEGESRRLSVRGGRKQSERARLPSRLRKRLGESRSCTRARMIAATAGSVIIDPANSEDRPLRQWR